MKYRNTLSLPILITLSCLVSLSTSSSSSVSLPNFIFVLADDLGYNAPGYRNPQLITPTLDNLAMNGVILDSFYTYKYCSPSRASFLSGRYPFKIESTRNNLIPFSQEDGVNLNFTFIPEKLKSAGYISHHIGKWHQGLYKPQYTPVGRGFASSDGFLAGGQDHFDQLSFGECGCKQYDIWVNTTIDPALQGQYNAFRFTQRATDIIINHANNQPNTPLFMYVALQNVHAPIEAYKSYETLYPNIKYPLQLAFDAMVSTIDDTVKNITETLKTTGLWNNTIFIWASDNGTPVDVGGSNYPLKGSKSTNFEGGVRTPAFVNGGLLPDATRGTRRSEMIHILDFYATFATLANVDPNDGTAIPIDSLNMWPYISGMNTTSPRTRIVHQHDMYTGSPLGAVRDGDYKLIVNEENFATLYGNDTIGNFTPPASGKLPNPTQCSPTKPCLFDIVNDPLETTDLSSTMPKKVKELMDIFLSYNNEHHPPTANPLKNETACCAVSANNGGYLAPWAT